VYEYRNIIHHKPYDFFKRSAYFEDRKRFEEWDEQAKNNYEKKFAYVDENDENKEDELNMRIIRKIYMSRRNAIEPMSYNELKK